MHVWLCAQLQTDDVVLRCNALDALNVCARSCEGDPLYSQHCFLVKRDPKP